MLLKAVTIVAVALAGFSYVQEGDDLSGVKCILNGNRAANAEKSVEFKGGKAYFCCGGCVAKFEKAMEQEEPDAAMMMKANHQLVATGQFVQKGCPISGNELLDDATTQVGGVEVGFCCNGCRDRVAKAEGLEAKAKIVFTEAAFKKGFAKKQDLSEVTCPISGGKVNAEQFADYKKGKVYFCCGNCKAKFEESNEKFVVKANQQLVTTGQFVQTGCPFSGGDVDDEKVVKVGGTDVKFCCGNCVKKMNELDSDQAKSEMVFSAKSFDRGFAKKDN